jgi:hypothetical protein
MEEMPLRRCPLEKAHATHASAVRSPVVFGSQLLLSINELMLVYLRFTTNRFPDK